MIDPYLRFPDWVYTSVDGLIWLNNGLKLPTNLEERACNAITKIYNEVEVGQPIIVDFRNVKDVADRALDNLLENIQRNPREVLFMNFEMISEQIEKVTSRIFSNRYSDFSIGKGGRCRIYNPLILTEQDYLVIVNEFRQKKVSEFVKSSFTLFDSPQYMTSTPLKATGIYDASKLLNNHPAFYWICLELADLLKNLINAGKITFKKEARILGVNMKASPFASVVSLLSDIPMITIDHSGPKHKAYDIDILDDLQNLRSYTYIYIGDFCIGGTEIKIAQTYARISNSDLNTAIVIGSYFEGEQFNTSFQLFSLVNIHGLHPNANFSI